MYRPDKSAWLGVYFELLCATEMVYPNPQVVCASVAIVFPKGLGKGCRLVADLSTINDQCKLVTGPMKNPWIEGDEGAGEVPLCTMDYLQGY